MYLFYLYHKDMDQPKRLKYDPVGWDTTGKRIKRDPKWHGVFFEYTPRLQFVKDGKAIIHYFYEKYGIQTEIICVIFKKNRKNRKYELNYTGKLNLTGLEISTLYATCNIEQTGFIQKFKNSQEVKVNVTDGGNVSVELHSKAIQRISKSHVLFGDSITEVGAESPDTLYLMFTTAGNEQDEISERFDYGTQVSTLNPVTNLKYIFKMKEAGNYAFNISTPFSLVANAEFNWNVQWKITYGKPGAYITENIGTVVSFSGTTFADGVGSFLDTLALTVDDEVYVYGVVLVSSNDGGFEMSYQPLYNPTPGEEENITYAYLDVVAETFFPATQAIGVLWHEALKRLVQKYTGKTNCFKSDYYGRTDIGYDVDGEGSLKLLLNGALIRGFEPPDKGVYISFKELLESSTAIDGVGVGVERIGDIETVVVEKFTYFFKPVRAAQLPFVRDIKKTVIDEDYFIQIDGGYDKWSNEAINNLDEFNAKREYKTSINQVNNKIQLRSSIIASGYTIEVTRREQVIKSETTDNDRDNEAFVIQLVREESGYAPETNDGMFLGNVFSPSTTYNARLSPMRCLKRNGAYLRTGLYHEDNELVELTNNEGNVKYFSKLSTEAEFLYEDEIQVSNLEKAPTLPERYEFKTKLTAQMLQDIEAEPYGYIEFAKDGVNFKRGYIESIEPDPKSDLTTFKLKRANL